MTHFVSNTIPNILSNFHRNSNKFPPDQRRGSPFDRTKARDRKDEEGITQAETSFVIQRFVCAEQDGQCGQDGFDFGIKTSLWSNEDCMVLDGYMRGA